MFLPYFLTKTDQVVEGGEAEKPSVQFGDMRLLRGVIFIVVLPLGKRQFSETGMTRLS
jgi:hypothetical protein